MGSSRTLCSACCLLCGLGLLGGCEGGTKGVAAGADVKAVPVVVPAPEDAAPPDPTASPLSDDETTLAAGQPPSLEALDPEQRRRRAAAIDEGRRLHREGDYRAALEAFERALAELPDEPQALSELGWSALFAGAHDRADDALRRAEALASHDDRLRASILYNRGRLAEAREQPAEAVDLYQRSLRLRPHPTVYRRLRTLEGGTRYRFGPEVRPLAGPYASLAELCAQERRLSAVERTSEPDDAFGCLVDAAQDLGGDVVQVPTEGEAGPFTAVRFVETRPSRFAARFHVGLQTPEGWFVVPEVASIGRDTPGVQERVTRLVARREAVPPDGGAVLVVEVQTRWAELEDEVERASETHRVDLLCGRGASGVPTCTGALPRHTEVRDGDALQATWSVDWEVTAAGMLVLRSSAAMLDEPVAAVIGEHPLAFP